MKRAIVVGCGLSGAVVARHLAEKLDFQVDIYERRNHMGGNMYDYVNDAGILVHQYGPHTFHTKKKELYDFMCQYAEWQPYKLTCGAVINDKYTPTPFNFQTIDDYYDQEKAEKIKQAIIDEFPGRQTAPVLELLNHENKLIQEYAQFLFDNDYSLYTAKQWGISPNQIDPSVLRRVPLRFNYNIGYFDDDYQVMPKVSYVEFFKEILNHSNICVHLQEDVKEHVKIDIEQGKIFFNGELWNAPFVYTGAIDELLDWKYGMLPYRSLRFEWRTEEMDSFQDAPVVAYPQAEGYTRITEYKKLPVQDVKGKTTIAVEYSVPYKNGEKVEQYYPIPSDENFELYHKYRKDVDNVSNLYLCGRLAHYKYYNMDQALESALELCERLAVEAE